MSLQNFTEREAPQLKSSPRQQLPVPAPEMEGLAGVGGYLESGEKAYVSPRTRRTHFFRLHKGYAVSDSILDYLRQSGIEVILVQERDTGNVLEYQIQDFRDFGISVNEERDDPQTCVPESRATTWEGHAEAVL